MLSEKAVFPRQEKFYETIITGYCQNKLSFHRSNSCRKRQGGTGLSNTDLRSEFFFSASYLGPTNHVTVKITIYGDFTWSKSSPGGPGRRAGCFNVYCNSRVGFKVLSWWTLSVAASDRLQEQVRKPDGASILGRERAGPSPGLSNTAGMMNVPLVYMVGTFPGWNWPETFIFDLSEALQTPSKEGVIFFFSGLTAQPTY